MFDKKESRRQFRASPLKKTGVDWPQWNRDLAKNIIFIVVILILLFSFLNIVPPGGQSWIIKI